MTVLILLYACTTKTLKKHKEKKLERLVGQLEGWLFGFYGISTFVGYLMPKDFYTNNQFYFQQLSLAWVHSLIVKNISISSYLIY